MRRKFIITLTNQIRFEPKDYTEEASTVKESVLTYIPINSILRQEIANEVTIKDLVFQDNVWFDLKSITEH